MPDAIEIDEDLSRLEHDIRQLKIAYEQYFGGGKKRPPNDVEWRIDQVLKRYGDRGAEMNYGQRFRYSNLAQTYAKYREIFHKRLRMREEGTAPRHFGAAARAIEAERRQASQARHAAPFAVTFADPAQEPKKVEELYRAFCKALEGAGESADRLSRENFERFLQQKSEQFREQRRDREVEFVVSIENGKARLKARVKP
jgi:hypothetical protein